jgi:O-antigen ligase
MGSVIVLALLAGVGCTALFLPWVGVAGAYLIGILNPQSIWWWSFEGARPVYWVLLPTLIGVVLMGLRGKLRWEELANIRVLCLLTIWITGMVSWTFAPYAMTTAGEGEFNTRGASFIMENLTKIVMLAIIAILCVRTTKQLRITSMALLLSGLYLTWWINDQYLFKGVWGRLGGPTALDGSGTYEDENLFGTLFVTALPFAWYFAVETKRLWLRLSLWVCIPLIWHGVFLTGSRGALLALAATMLTIVIRMKRKDLGIVLVLLFVSAFVWQAGDTMKERAASIDSYSEDESATGRLEAWEAGGKMMTQNILTGVGPGAFLRAFPNYSDKKPRQAHNTLIQFGAEFGPLALLAVGVMLASCVLALWKIKPIWRTEKSTRYESDVCLREATLAAVIGLIISSLFLSLQLFEVFYFLVFLSGALISRNKSQSKFIAEQSNHPGLSAESGRSLVNR